MLQLLASLVALALLTSGCGLGGPSEVNLEPPLHTIPYKDQAACRPVPLRGTLHGDPADPSVAWLELMDTGVRREVVWPAGYRARFIVIGDDPVLKVYDSTDVFVIGASDVVASACATGDASIFLLKPPFD